MNLICPVYSIVLFKLTLYWSTLWVEMYSVIKICKPMYSLSFYLNVCCNTVEYMYIHLLDHRQIILKQTNKSAFSRKYYARILQSRLKFSQYKYFYSSGQVEFMFQPVTCKRAEVKRAHLIEPTFYLNY